MRNFKGAKYDANMDVVEIAKRLRSEIKEEVKAGRLPKGKYSVRIDRYSMGQSIDINIMDVEGPILNPDHDRMSADEEKRRYYVPKIHEALAKLEGMLQAYNRDNSDTMTDYFDVKFYGHAKVHWELEARERKAA